VTNLTCQGGLRDVQDFGCTPEVLFPTDCPKVTQVTQLHAALIPLQYQKRKSN